MKNIVLDTNVLIQHPQVLGLNISDVKLIIPDQVRFELSMSASKKNEFMKILNLVNESINKGIIYLGEHPNKTESTYGQAKSDTSDILIASYVLQLSKEEKDTILVTDDIKLREYCKPLGIVAISYSMFQKHIYQLRNPTAKQNEITKKADDISRSQTNKFILGVTVGLFSGLLLALAFYNFNLIVSKINIWGTFIAIILAGIGLFYFRCWKRFEYGITEFVFGIYTALIVFMPTFDYMTFDRAKSLQLMSALYIIVRGLDNIDKGMKNKKFESIWRKIFGNS